jgi:NAD(P)-dependent dehydrogenase (short-subunit alcohol dehydrogenase family)
MANNTRPVALITGASRGLGLALARALISRGWSLIIDARGQELEPVEQELSTSGTVVALRGSVADPVHRRELVEAARSLGGLDLPVKTFPTAPCPRKVFQACCG